MYGCHKKEKTAITYNKFLPVGCVRLESSDQEPAENKCQPGEVTF